jgi:hypothetical protein
MGINFDGLVRSTNEPTWPTVGSPIGTLSSHVHQTVTVAQIFDRPVEGNTSRFSFDSTSIHQKNMIYIYIFFKIIYIYVYAYAYNRHIYILISSSTPGASKRVLERNLRRRMFTLATTLGFSKGGDNPHSYPKVGIGSRAQRVIVSYLHLP